MIIITVDLLLVVSLFVPGVGMTSVPNVPAAADVPAVTYIHAVALYILAVAGIPAVTDFPAVAIGILNIWVGWDTIQHWI
jgi:hypothetical protein